MTRILGVDVNWMDRCANSPDLILLVDEYPEHRVYTKRPFSPEAKRPAGWHVYWSEVDGLVWFFTWGGQPDDGFGGYARDVQLDDGTVEHVVGGWHASSDIPPQAGFPAVARVVLKDDPESGGRSAFALRDRLELTLAKFRPDLELIDDDMGFPAVKWRGRVGKHEYLRTTDRTRSPYSLLGASS